MIKKFFEDYAIAQGACNKFYKEHWKGQIVLSVLAGLTTYGIAVAIEQYQEKKRVEKRIDEDLEYVRTH